jgi:hypothetical protein
MTTMADLDELALALPQTTKEVSEDGRPSYLVHGKLFCCHRSRRRDALLLQIPDLARLDRDELHDLVAEAWLTRAKKRVARAWLSENAES